MRTLRFVLGCLGVALAAGIFAGSQPPSQTVSKPASVPLVLAGGTVVDVSNWGHSAADQRDAIVIVRDGRITDVGPRATVQIPKDAEVIDCTGKYLIPGLVDGYAGLNSQGQANAHLYMGVTTVVVGADNRHGHIDFAANPSPHMYLMDSVGSTDNWSLLNGHGDWSTKLNEGARPVELSPDVTARQIAETARLGTRVLRLGWNITAANTQVIITRAHQLGLVTYGEFISTPYKVGIDAGVDALPHMGRYELGVIPDELQRPLVDDPFGTAANTAYDYAEHLPPMDPHFRAYGRFIAAHHGALMPTFSMYFLRLPGHRNLWHEPAAALLDPANMYMPPDRETGEIYYPLSSWTRRLPGSTQRWMEEGQRKKADLSAMRLWRINQTLFGAYPHYLAASGASAMGTMAGISLHTELEMLVRIGLSAREALAASTNNYALQFGWNELGLITPGRRGDILVVDADPSINVWNARRISTIVLDGNVVDREGLLKPKR
jgi:hypothetical protein